MTAARKTPTRSDPDQADKNDGIADELSEPLDDDPILDLTELAPKRPTVLFITNEERAKATRAKREPKPTRYELRVPQDFDVEEEHGFRAEAREFDALMNKDKLTRAEKANLRQLLEGLFDRALIAPLEVKRQFSDRNQQAVVKHFTLALLREDAEMIEQALPLMPGLASQLRPITER